MTAPRAMRTARVASRAFTLIEMVATIVVIAVIGTVSSTLIVTAADGYYEAENRASLHAELSVGLDRLVREVRMIARDELVAARVPDIDTISPTSISWEGSNSATLSGTNLLLTIAPGTPAILLADVSAFSFQAYDEANIPLAANLTGPACDDIHRIAATITLSRQGVSESLRSIVFIRSLTSTDATP